MQILVPSTAQPISLVGISADYIIRVRKQGFDFGRNLVKSDTCFEDKAIICVFGEVHIVAHNLNTIVDISPENWM